MEKEAKRAASRAMKHAIFCDIENDKYTDEEKALAIYEIMNWATHNSVTKDKMLDVIKWLFNKCYEVTKE